MGTFQQIKKRMLKPSIVMLGMLSATLTIQFVQSADDRFNRGPVRAARHNMTLLQNKIYRQLSQQGDLVPFNDEGEVLLNVTLKISQIFGLDEVTETVDSYVFIFVFWEDKDLAWDPKEYSDIDEVHLSKERMWSPTLNIINAADTESILVEVQHVVHLYSNGVAYYAVPKFVKSSCPLNFYLYPIDMQECYISVVPAKYITSGLRIAHGHVTELRIAPSVMGEWTVLAKSVNMSFLAGYSLMDVRLTLSRRKLFYIVFVLTPLFVTSFLIIFVFWIPPSSGERISYLISIFLSTTLLLNIVGDKMPRSIDEMPLFLQLILVAITENVLALVCTMFVMKKYADEQNQDKSNDVIHTDEDNEFDNCVIKMGKKIRKPKIGHENYNSVRKKSNSCDYYEEQINNEREDGVVCWKCQKSASSRVRNLAALVVRKCLWNIRLTTIKARTWDRIFFVTFLCTFVLLSLALSRSS